MDVKPGLSSPALCGLSLHVCAVGVTVGLPRRAAADVQGRTCICSPGPCGHSTAHTQLRGQGCRAFRRSRGPAPSPGVHAFLLGKAGAGERGCVQFAGHWGWTLPHLDACAKAQAWGEQALFEEG